MTSRVREVKLRMRVDAAVAGDLPTLREHAEQRFLRNVLQRLEDAVHARFGAEAWLYVRVLPLRLTMTADELVAPAFQRRVAQELIDGMVSQLRSSVPTTPRARTASAQPRPRPGAEVVLLQDRAHALAVALAEQTEGSPVAPYHPASTLDALWQLVEADRECAADVRALLQSYGVLDEALATAAAGRVAPPKQRDAIASANVPSAPPPHARDRGERRATHQASRGLGDEPRARATQDVPAGQGVAPSTAVSVEPRVVASTAAHEDFERAGGAADDPELLPRASFTRWGGLFFLLGAVSELELGEHLWCAGVDEGPFLAAVLARLLPSDERTDGSLDVIAGAWDGSRTTAASLPTWAAGELMDKTRDSLGRWLARRAVALSAGELQGRLQELAATAPGEVASEDEDVLVWMNAALAAVVSTRLELPWTWSPLQALVPRDARMVVSEDEVRILMPLASVRLDLRRAGLDQDPGWVPWLARRVRIVFEAGHGDAY